MSDVITPPMSCTSPVPTRLRMPSASVITREMRTPVCVESKKRMGRRATCACTLLRISVMARCAATPKTCESVNEVMACTTLAAPLDDDLVNQVLRAGRQDEPDQTIHEHQHHPQGEARAVSPNQLPRVAP